MIGGDGERSVSLENPLCSGSTRVAIFMPAGVASGDIAQNYLLEPLSQAAATQLYRKDTQHQILLRPSLLRAVLASGDGNRRAGTQPPAR